MIEHVQGMREDHGSEQRYILGFARKHQPEDKEEFRRVPVRFCPVCGRMIEGEEFQS